MCNVVFILTKYTHVPSLCRVIASRKELGIKGLIVDQPMATVEACRTLCKGFALFYYFVEILMLFTGHDVRPSKG